MTEERRVPETVSEEVRASLAELLHESDSNLDDIMTVLAEGTNVRRRYEFFVWAQVRLRTVLAYDVLVCGVPRNQSARMLYDYYYSSPLDPEALSKLCHPKDGLANDLLDRWISDGFDPIVISRGAEDQTRAALGDQMALLGFGDCIVHGIPKAQATALAHCIFIFVSMDRISESQRRMAQLMVPYIFSAYSRALSRERPATELPQSGADATVTEREVEILRWVREGKSNMEIGMILSISPLTVKNHVQKILRKLNATNRAQAVSKAISLRLLSASSMRQPNRPDSEED